MCGRLSCLVIVSHSMHIDNNLSSTCSQVFTVSDKGLIMGCWTRGSYMEICREGGGGRRLVLGPMAGVILNLVVGLQGTSQKF